jgi:U3 small nucleolar RNA-associated protein MPP10
VKNIKPKGKGLPLSGLMEDIDFDDENGLQMGFEDLDDAMIESEAEQSSVDEDGEDEEGRATIERLKDDLFAEDEELDSSKTDHVYFDASFITWLQI